MSNKLDEFYFALQLSIDNKIETNKVSVISSNSFSNALRIGFNEKPKDERWNYFEKIAGGEWKKSTQNSLLYIVPNGFQNLEELTQFLFITRLRKVNMLKIVEIHPEYKKYVEKVFPKSQLSSSSTLKTLEECKRIIFEEIARQNLTLNKLSHQTSLSMVSLSNFKAGNDIRLSTFLKIASALGITLTLALSPQGRGE